VPRDVREEVHKPPDNRPARLRHAIDELHCRLGPRGSGLRQSSHTNTTKKKKQYVIVCGCNGRLYLYLSLFLYFYLYL
jgi:hypothetical protein